MTPVTDNRNLDDRERELLRKLLSDPLSFPLEFKQWLRNYLETSDMILPRQSIHGLKDGRPSPPGWEDVGEPGVGGGIREITSVDSTVQVTDPTGPTADLSVPGGGTGFSHVGQGIHTVYFTAAILLAWWRMGVNTPFPTVNSTPNFILDESPNHYNLTAINRDYSGNPYTTGLPVPVDPGALAPGNADDGGWKSSLQFGGSVEYSQLGFAAPIGMEPSLIGAPIGSAWSFSCWLRPTKTGTGGYYPVVTSHQRQFGIGNGGSALLMDSLTGKLIYNTGQYNNTLEFNWASPFGLSPDFWHHFVVTIIKLGTDSYRRRIYLNTNLLYDQTGPQSVIANAAGVGGANLSIFYGNSNDIWTYGGPSMVDEVAMWTGELDQADVDALWNGRVLNDGDIWTTGVIDPVTDIANGSIGTAKLADGAVSTAKLADGSVTAAKIADAAGGMWLTGTSAPTSGQGTSGDWYLNTTSGQVSRKVDATTWQAVGYFAATP